jgi:fucose 4-O-acetylase-like acetyltransferase
LRNYRIDAFRLYTLFLVGWAHIEFLEEFSPKSLPTKVLQLAIIIGVRYTIPFFFIVSGYFVGGKMALEPSNAIPIAVKSSKKLVQAFLFWSMIYAIEQPKKFLYLVQQRPLNFYLKEQKYICGSWLLCF